MACAMLWTRACREQSKVKRRLFSPAICFLKKTGFSNKTRFLPFLIIMALLALGPLPLIRAEAPDGAALYQQWCSTCHGDQGQGLTEEWRATWPEGKQNCWQSKCHASNHPPDGFSFPKTVPALIGRDTLAKFHSAQDLYIYIQATMPYWSPAMLSGEEYMAITTFLIESNYSEQGLSVSTVSLSQNLATIPLRPTAQALDQPIPEAAAPPGQLDWRLISLVIFPLAIALGLGLWLKIAR
jgi:mono/diheme cytochrome c family protein